MSSQTDFTAYGNTRRSKIEATGEFSNPELREPSDGSQTNGIGYNAVVNAAKGGRARTPFDFNQSPDEWGLIS